MDATAELKKDKKRRKKSTGNNSRSNAVHPPSSEMDIDNAPAKVKPLGLASQTAGANANVAHTHSQTHGNADKPASSAAAKVQKLEQKIEKQRSRLKEAEVRLLKTEEKGKRDAERILALEAKVKEQEETLKSKEEEAAGQKQRADDHAKTIEGHLADKDQVQETLQEAVSCLICSDTLRDPHILSCGHIACRDCLKSWFRQPNAYLHDVGERPISSERDLSYRSKVCHVCRTTVFRRPTRMYNLYSFLEPLGIVPNIPTVSQEAADPWEKTFPEEKSSYKLYDDEDDTARCPQCLHEVYDASCDNCGAEFSNEGGDDDDQARFGMMSEDEDDDDSVTGGVGGRRRAQVDIATIEEVLGDSTEDGEAVPRRRADRVGAGAGAVGRRSNRRNPRVEARLQFDNSDDEQDFDGNVEFALQIPGLRNPQRGRTGVRHPAAPYDHAGDDSDNSDGTHGFSDHSELSQLSQDELGTEDEYDGSVPRDLPAAFGIVQSDDDEEMDEEESAYGGSFIDDDEDEEGYDLESTGSLRDEGDEDVDNADASDGLGIDIEGEDLEQEGSQPNMGQLRRLRLQRLIDSRRPRRDRAASSTTEEEE